MPDAMVIGAGPAGALAALLLARCRWRVTIVEQSRFPRDKVCGECLSALGVSVLRRTGLLPALLDRGAVWLPRATLHARDGPSLTVELPRPMLGISRRVLDHVLLAAAHDAGATLLQPVRCEKVETGDRPAAVVRDLAANAVSRRDADLLLLADGKSALLDRKPPPTGDLGLKTHFELPTPPPTGIDLFGFTGHYGGLSPIESNRWNFAISVGADRMKQARGDGDVLLAELLSSCPPLRRTLEGARRVAPWLASPLPRFPVVGAWPPHVIPLGNAAAAIEPVGGEGMGLALRSAELAVEAVTRRRGRFEGSTLRGRFITLYRRRAIACRGVARLLGSPILSRPALVLARRSPALVSFALSAMGKRATF